MSLKKRNTKNLNQKTSAKKLTINDILNLKRKKEKISVITSYDYWSAKICDAAGIDILLVGDSAGMVMLGYPNTNLVSMKEMLISRHLAPIFGEILELIIYKVYV